MPSHYKELATEIFATWFYLGKSPLIPGTVGTIGAIPLVWLFYSFGNYNYMVASSLLTLAAVMAATLYEEKLGVHDSSQIVIDEVAGFVIAMTWLPMTWQAFAIGLLVFRLLDILKPFPIGWLERRIEGGLGVVVDDVAAGIIANIVLQVIYSRTDWLGHQLVL